MPSSGARQTQPAGGLDGAAARGERRQGAPPDEGVAAPALAPLDRLEEEPVTVADDVGEARDGREGVGDHLAPDRHDGVLLGQRGELGRRPDGSPARPGPRAGSGRQWTSRRGHPRARADRAVEAGALPRVTRAAPVLVDQDDERVAVAVDAHLADVLAVAGGLALLPVLLAAPAVEPRAARRRASAAAPRRPCTPRSAPCRRRRPGRWRAPARRPWRSRPRARAPRRRTAGCPRERSVRRAWGPRPRTALKGRAPCRCCCAARRWRGCPARAESRTPRRAPPPRSGLRG